MFELFLIEKENLLYDSKELYDRLNLCRKELSKLESESQEWNISYH